MGSSSLSLYLFLFVYAPAAASSFVLYRVFLSPPPSVSVTVRVTDFLGALLQTVAFYRGALWKTVEI